MPLIFAVTVYLASFCIDSMLLLQQRKLPAFGGPGGQETGRLASREPAVWQQPGTAHSVMRLGTVHHSPPQPPQI